MNKFSYEIVAIEAEKLIIKIATASSKEDSLYYYHIFNVYLDSCGWTANDFDLEMLSRIDKSWEINNDLS